MNFTLEYPKKKDFFDICCFCVAKNADFCDFLCFPFYTQFPWFFGVFCFARKLATLPYMLNRYESMHLQHQSSARKCKTCMKAPKAQVIIVGHHERVERGPNLATSPGKVPLRSGCDHNSFHVGMVCMKSWNFYCENFIEMSTNRSSYN